MWSREYRHTPPSVSLILLVCCLLLLLFRRWTRHAKMEAAYELRLIMARSAVTTGNLAEAAR